MSEYINYELVEIPII